MYKRIEGLISRGTVRKAVVTLTLGVVPAFPVKIFAAEVRRIEDTVPFRVFQRGTTIDQIVFKPGDSSVAVVAHRNDHIALIDTSHLSTYWTRTFSRYNGPLDFTHDGRLLAVRDGADLVVLDVNTGAEFKRFPVKNFTRVNDDSAAAFVRFNATDSKLMVATDSDVFLVDLASGQVEQEFRSIRVPGTLHFIRTIEWSGDERFLFVMSWKGLVVFNVTSGTWIRTVDVPAITGLTLNTVRDVRVTSDGAFAAISNGKHVYVVDTQNAMLVRKILASAADIQDMNLTDDQCCFIVASLDGTSRVYEIATGEQLTRLDDSRPAGIRSSLMSSSSPGRLDILATGDADGIVRMWRPAR